MSTLQKVEWSWDGSRPVLWMAACLADGRCIRVGIPVGHIMATFDEEMGALGIYEPPIMGECATMSGWFSRAKRAVRRHGKKARRALKRTRQRVTRKAMRVVKSRAAKRFVDPRRLVPKKIQRSKAFKALAAPERFAPQRVRKNDFFRAASDPAAAQRLAKHHGPLALRAAATGASFVPGVGTGAATALGAGAAYAEGKDWKQIAREAALSAVPGGAAVRMAADAGMRALSGERLDRAVVSAAERQVPPNLRPAFRVGRAMAQGQRVDRALLDEARRHTPGGPAGRMAFNLGAAVARGQSTRRAAVEALPAVGGQALRSLAAARQVSRQVAAARQLGRQPLERLTPQQRAFVGRGAHAVRGVAALRRSNNPRAKLAVAALRSFR